MRPPSPAEILARAEREGKGTVTVSIGLYRRLLAAATLADQLASETGITDNDPRLGSSWGRAL